MKIKVVALDVYGTMLPTIGEQVKRKGLDLLLEKCKNQDLILCTISDAEINEVLKDFKEGGLNREYFRWFFKIERKGEDFNKYPKNFMLMLQHYKKQNIFPEEILVVGDKENRDIKPALDSGCKAILVPEYYTKNNNDFDINSVDIK